jgi:hypothetical protein
MLAAHEEPTAAADAGDTGIGKPVPVAANTKRDHREDEETRLPGFLLPSE